MKIFQFYFNPLSFNIFDSILKNSSFLKWFFKPKESALYQSFCFGPSEAKERKNGHLFIVSQLANDSQDKKKLMGKIAEIAQTEYYQPDENIEKLFNQTLEKINKFLEKNKTEFNGLSIAILAVSENLESFFSKIGDIKIYALKNSSYFNIGDNASFNSGSLNSFSNVMQGSFEENDRLLIMNSSLFEQFWANKFFDKLKFFEKPKELKSFFKTRKEVLRRFSGILVYAFIEKDKNYFHLPKINLAKKINKGIFSLLLLLILIILGFLLFR